MSAKAALRRVVSGAVVVGLSVAGLTAGQSLAPETAHASTFVNNSKVFTAKSPSGTTVDVPMGAVGYPGATGELPGWCTEWTQWNVRTVKPESKSTVSSGAAANLAYIYETRKHSSSYWPTIAVASHELLDPTKNRTDTQSGDFGAPWGYYRKQAGDFKNAVETATGWIENAEERRGPYKMAPALSLASSKKTISLTGTGVKTASGANLHTFNSNAVRVTGTITGPAEFNNGTKTKVFDAGDAQTLSVTGIGRVSVSLKTAAVLPSGSVVMHKYARGISQDKAVVTPMKAATAGSAAVTVPAPVPTYSVTTSAVDTADKDKKIEILEGKAIVPAKISDTVNLKYTDVVKGAKFTVTSTLWNKTDNKTTGITATSTITADAINGTDSSVSTFSIPNARTYAGKNLVAYASVKNAAGKVVATHNDINASSQTVGVAYKPQTFSVTTTAVDNADKDKRIDILKGTGIVAAKIADTVNLTYSNVEIGTKFTVTSTLWNKTDNKTTGITATSTITASAMNGTNSSVSTFAIPNARTYANKSLVAYAEVKNAAGKIVASHKDINAASQTVGVAYLPQTFSVTTDAVDNADKDKRLDILRGTAVVSAKIADTVSLKYANVEKGTVFNVTSTLYDKTTGASTGITATSKITTTAMNGTNSSVSTFTVPNVRTYMGKNLVAYAEVRDTAGVLVASHKDINAATQTVGTGYLPQTFTVTTAAVDSADKDKKIEILKGTSVAAAKIADTVTLKYTNVEKGQVFNVASTLYDKTTGKTTGIVATSKITAPLTVSGTTLGTASSVSTFTIPNARTYIGKSLVAYAEITDSTGKVVASHKDINAATQTVSVGYLPQTFTVTTNAVDSADKDKRIEILKGTGVVAAKIADTVTLKYTNVEKGRVFTVTSTLVDKATGVATGITATSKITAPAAVTGATEGTASAVSTYSIPNARTYAGKSLVAYAEIRDPDGLLVASHKDVTAASQTVAVGYLPQTFAVTTSAVDNADKDKRIEILKGTAVVAAKIADTVELEYTNVERNRIFTVTSTLMDKSTGKTTGITATSTIKAPATVSGATKGKMSSVSTFNIPNARLFTGKQLVAYAEIRDPDGLLVASHKDINAATQTVDVGYLPQTFTVTTTALDNADKDKRIDLLKGTNTVAAKIADTVTLNYTNVEKGTVFNVTSTLMDKSTGKTTGITATSKMTASVSVTGATKGTASSVSTFAIPNARLFDGKKLVAYAEITNPDGLVVASHKDINAVTQTVDVGVLPQTFSVTTDAFDTADKDKRIDLLVNSTKVPGSISDTVTLTYTNVNINSKFTVTSTLMDKTTGLSTGITAKSTITATTKDGSASSVSVFNLPDATKFMGKQLVAYAEITDSTGLVVATHKNMNAVSQTVSVLPIPQVFTVTTEALDAAGKDKRIDLFKGSDVVAAKITDTVTLKYTNAVIGAKFTVKSTLMNKKTGKSTGITATSTITASALNGENSSVSTFVIPNARDYDGVDLVAYADITDSAGTKVASHTDINSVTQMVSVGVLPQTFSVTTSALDVVDRDRRIQLFSGTDVVPSSIEDTINLTFTNVRVGAEFTVKSTLMEKGAAVSTGIVTTSKITATKSNGKNSSVAIFNLPDARKYVGKSLVAFAEIRDETGLLVASHVDYNAATQTVAVSVLPQLFATVTQALDEEDKNQRIDLFSALVNVPAKIEDTVSFSYQNVTIGNKYSVLSTLMDKETKKSTGITATTTITASKNTGTDKSVPVFNIPDARKYAGKQLVAFAEIKDSTGKIVSTHKDYEAASQTITVSELPSVTTKNLDGFDGDKMIQFGEAPKVDKDGNVTTSSKTGISADTVTGKNFLVGEKYTVKGWLMEPNGTNTGIKSEKTFDATSSDVTMRIDFKVPGPKIVETSKMVEMDNPVPQEWVNSAGEVVKFPALDELGKPLDKTIIRDPKWDSKVTKEVISSVITPSPYEGKKLVAFQEVFDSKGRLVADHKDLNAVDQTVEFFNPKMGTTATDNLDGDKVLEYSGGIVKDVIDYSGFPGGVDVTFSGELMDKVTKKATGIRGSTTSRTPGTTAETVSGSVVVEFKVPAGFHAREMTAFEVAKIANGSAIAVHEDINSAAQTFKVAEKPTIGTIAKDLLDGDQYFAYNGGVVDDYVQYKNLIPGKSYTLKGRALVTGSDEEMPFSGETTFTPTEAAGEVIVKVTLPEGYEGKTFSFRESLFDHEGSFVVAHNKEGDEKDQTVYIAKIGTEALDAKDDDHYLPELGGKVVDKVKYENLAPGKPVTVKGKMVIHGTGEETTIASEETFTPKTPNGVFEIVFDVPEEFSGKSLTAYEYVYDAIGTLLAKHEDPNDAEQTIHVAKITTSAEDKQDGDKYIADNGGTIIDKVTYTNFEPGERVNLKGKLVFHGSGEETGIEADDSFLAKESNGVFELEFKIPAKFAGKSLTAYEYAYDVDENLIADHTDPNDAEQTVHVAHMATEALDEKDGDHFLHEVGGVVIDKIKYTNFPVGKEVSVKGKLVTFKEGNETGNESEAKFTPEETNGVFELKFEVPEGYKGKSLTAFEEAHDTNGNRIAKHEDPEDAEQTVYIAEIKTEATDTEDGDHFFRENGGKLVDKIKYTNLPVGKEVLVKGKLVIHVSGEETGIEAEGLYTPEESNGFFELEFTIPEGYKGKNLTAFEYVYETEGELIAKHEDPEDEKQTVYVAEIGTEAIDLEDGDKFFRWDGGKLVDKIKYTNLPVGEEVTVKGKVVVHVSGEETEITAEDTFTPEESNGYFELEFRIPDTHKGKSLTVLEYAYDTKGNLVAKHEDPNDANQTVYVAEIGTEALDAKDGDHFLFAEGGEVVDKIKYTNFVVGEEVTVKGKLVIHKSGEKTEIEAEGKFTPEETNGVFELKFTVPEGFHGKSLTAFEYAYDTEGNLIAKHEDPEDEEQTVHVADLGTEATDLKDGDHNINAAGGEVVDKVKYTNLPVGVEVTVKGKIVIHKSGEETGIESEAKFTPEESNGVFELKFTIPEGFTGKSLTVYEYVYNAEGELIVKHEDPEDKDQTVYVADMATEATDDKDQDKFILAEGGVVVDKIKYTNFAVGKEVLVKGKMVIHVSGEETGIESEAKFTPKKTDGVFELKFDVPEGFRGKDLTVYEYSYDAEGDLIAKHEDPNDKEQTVYVTDLGTKATDSEDGDKSISPEGGTVKDTVWYTNLPGGKYTVEGVAMRKTESGTCKPTDYKGKTKLSVLVESTKSGEVDVMIEIPKGNAEETFVIFETVRNSKGKIVAEHKDCDDLEQTVYMGEEPPVVIDSGSGAGVVQGGDKTPFIVGGIALLVLLMISIALVNRRRNSITTK